MSLKKFLKSQIQDHIRQDPLGTFDRYTNLRVLVGQSNRRDRRCGYKLLQQENESDNRINPEELFDAGNWNDHSDPRVVLMRGRAGIGKTSFVRKLVYEWAVEDIWTKKFQAVYLFQLRDFNSSYDATNNLSCYQLIMTRHGPDVREVDEQRIWENIESDTNNVLVIFDGMDEYRGYDKESGFPGYFNSKEKIPIPALFGNILKGNILSRAHIILTSRPRAIGLRNLERSFHRTVEICGFDTKGVKEYFKNNFRNDPKKLQRVMKFLEANSNLFSICYIPVVCSFLVECIGEIVDHTDTSTCNWCQNPQTMTQIFTLAIQYFILNHHDKYRSGLDKPKHPVEAFLPFRESFLALAKLAAWGMTCTPMYLVFTPEDLKQAQLEVTPEMMDFGLLHSIKKIDNRVFNTEKEEWSYLHLIVMEYMTSVNFCIDEWERIEKVIDMADTGQFDTVYLFLMGLLGDPKCHDFTRRLFDLSQDQLETMRQKAERLLRALGNKFRAKEARMTKESKFLLLMLLSEGKLEHMADEVFGWVAEARVIGEYGQERTLDGLNLSESHLNTADCKVVGFLLDNIQQPPAVINLNNNPIGNDGLEYLCNHTKLLSCPEVKLAETEIDSTGVKFIPEALKNNSGLTSLDLGSNRIGKICMKHIAAGLRCCDTLTELDLSENNIEIEGVLSLKDLLPHSNLQVLRLEDNNIGDEGMEHLCEVLPKCCLRELSIGDNHIGPKGMEYLGHALPRTQLKNIGLFDNTIGDLGAKNLAMGLVNSQVEEFNLATNDIGDEGVVHLAQKLSTSNLANLLLYDNAIGDEGAKSLARTLPYCKIRLLSLCGTNVTKDGAQSLAEAVHNHPTINYVSLTVGRHIAEADKEDLLKVSSQKISFYPE